jgi:spore maturation protein CgeB
VEPVVTPLQPRGATRPGAQGRVLVVGPAKVGDMAWFLALAYRRLGWQVATLDDRAHVGRGIPGTAGKVLQALERDRHLSNRSRHLGELVLQRARQCDHVVAVKGEYFLPEHVAQVSAVVPFVNWHPDHPVLSQDLLCIPHYTVFCPKDSWSTERLRGMGLRNVRTLPHASDPEVLGGARVQARPRSFSVVGSSYPYRNHWVRLATQSGLTAHTWGGKAHGADDAGPVVARAQQALGEEQGEALRTGCFTLNTHHPFDIAGGNQRVFDAAAAGAPQLTEQLPETVKHFKPGTEIATFEDAEQFVAQIEELTRDGVLAERLARQSHERLREEHTYEHRVQTLLGML